MYNYCKVCFINSVLFRQTCFTCYEKLVILSDFKNILNRVIPLKLHIRDTNTYNLYILIINKIQVEIDDLYKIIDDPYKNTINISINKLKINKLEKLLLNNINNCDNNNNKFSANSFTFLYHNIPLKKK